MFRIIAATLVLGWLIGFTVHVAGGLIHIVLALAIIGFVADLLSVQQV